MMNLTVSYSEIRQNLKREFDKVCQDHVPVLVVRKNGENVVVISEADFQSFQEMAHLCQSPRNLERLLQALNRSGGKSLEQVRDELAI
jgi:antitoxin YefM